MEVKKGRTMLGTNNKNCSGKNNRRKWGNVANCLGVNKLIIMENNNGIEGKECCELTSKKKANKNEVEGRK